MTNKQYWDELNSRPDHLDRDGAYMHAYAAFMFDESNVRNCGKCPWDGKCGQQQCWVLFAARVIVTVF